MRGLCFSNKGIYKFETTPKKVKLNELNNNTVEELSIAEFDYKLYSGLKIKIKKNTIIYLILKILNVIQNTD